MPTEAAVASALAWAIVALIAVALALVIHQHPTCSAGEVVVLLIASMMVALAGGMASLVFAGVLTNASDVAWLVIIFRAVGTALYLGVLLNVSGWRPPILGRWL